MKTQRDTSRPQRSVESRWEEKSSPACPACCPVTYHLSRNLHQDLGLGAQTCISAAESLETLTNDGGPATEEGHPSRTPCSSVSPGCWWRRLPRTGSRAAVLVGHSQRRAKSWGQGLQGQPRARGEQGCWLSRCSSTDLFLGLGDGAAVDPLAHRGCPPVPHGQDCSPSASAEGQPLISPWCCRRPTNATFV